jgi:anaerobic ribonucleoside-triphosphate reductase activating protein
MPDYWERRSRLLHHVSQRQQSAVEQPEAQLQLAAMIEESIVDGPGMRFVLFTQGCPHRCPGCHNPQTHLSVGGTYYPVEQIIARYDENPACRGITFSGGEPFVQAAVLAQLAEAVHRRDGDVVVYTGYWLEQLQRRAKTDVDIRALLDATDLLVDGPFIQEKRCLGVPMVGSLNQRLIALTPLGNLLLNDIPIVPEGATVKRIRFTAIA